LQYSTYFESCSFDKDRRSNNILGVKNILITGATGNVGMTVIQSLMHSGAHQTVAAVRDIIKAQKTFSTYPSLEYVSFDFEVPSTFASALEGIDILFLLRPPQIADVDKYFKPLLVAAKSAGVTQIVFLSVQGAQKSSIIPHHKIEDLIISGGFEYVFLRPGYFMQNLTTTLYANIQDKREITVPAGKAKFNWVDVSDIGRVAAAVMTDFGSYKNQAIELTGTQNLSFYEVVDTINNQITRPLAYTNQNPIWYLINKLREGNAPGHSIVLMLLHMLPRFQPAPAISENIQRIIGKPPTTLKEFILQQKSMFL
jgi:uncharacterized protein YbjT (DUF2867 family)